MVILVNEESAQQSCTTSTRRKRDATPAYISQEFLLNAMQENKELIEMVICRIYNILKLVLEVVINVAIESTVVRDNCYDE